VGTFLVWLERTGLVEEPLTIFILFMVFLIIIFNFLRQLILKHSGLTTADGVLLQITTSITRGMIVKFKFTVVLERRQLGSSYSWGIIYQFSNYVGVFLQKYHNSANFLAALEYSFIIFTYSSRQFKNYNRGNANHFGALSDAF
jgi:hypothetical protein